MEGAHLLTWRYRFWDFTHANPDDVTERESEKIHRAAWLAHCISWIAALPHESSDYESY
jgi:hypothetical protein